MIPKSITRKWLHIYMNLFMSSTHPPIWDCTVDTVSFLVLWNNLASAHFLIANRLFLVLWNDLQISTHFLIANHMRFFFLSSNTWGFSPCPLKQSSAHPLFDCKQSEILFLVLWTDLQISTHSPSSNHLIIVIIIIIVVIIIVIVIGNKLLINNFDYFGLNHFHNQIHESMKIMQWYIISTAWSARHQNAEEYLKA